MTPNTYPNREAWLLAFTAAARPAFEQAGAPIPENVRMAVGFCSTGRKGKRIGECWSDKASGDGTFEIFITPQLNDSARIAGVLTHELIHAAVGLEAKHGKAFKRIAVALGLEGKMTATTEGDAWREWAEPILAELGPIPHAALDPDTATRTGPKEQKGRNIKVECDDCGFTFRTTQKWLDAAEGELRCPSANCGGIATAA